MSGPAHQGAPSRAAGAPISEWWLDESSLPVLIWARVMSGQDGLAVSDADGRLHLFESDEDAVRWLRQEEYAPLDELKRDGALPADLAPPDR